MTKESRFKVITFLVNPFLANPFPANPFLVNPVAIIASQSPFHPKCYNPAFAGGGIACHAKAHVCTSSGLLITEHVRET